MKKMSIAEFLETQKIKGYIGIIKPDQDSEQNIVFTPLDGSGECNCFNAITIDKSAVESVSITESKQFCCGELYPVVEIIIRDGYQIPFSDVIKLISSRNSQVHPNKHAENFGHISTGANLVNTHLSTLACAGCYKDNHFYPVGASTLINGFWHRCVGIGSPSSPGCYTSAAWQYTG